jgi:hypothetical protein
MHENCRACDRLIDRARQFFGVALLDLAARSAGCF